MMPMIPRNPSILLLLLLLLPLCSAFFSPIDSHFIVPASSPVSSDRRLFLPDSSALLRSPNPIIISSDPNPDSSVQSLLRCARIFTRPSAYQFKIKNPGPHLIRLHFSPFSTPDFNLSSAVFHVTASSFVLLTSFTPSSSAPSTKEYLLPVETDTLVLSFLPARPSSFAYVSAIEVVSSPEDLILPNVPARLISPDGSIDKFNGLSKQAMETLYRINVGGPVITPANDTLWRTWVPDTGFLVPDSASRAVSFSGRIMYQKFGASREVAPDFVYNSARVVSGGGNDSDVDFNMTWVFPVSLRYKYLVRMHFCDIASLVLNQLYFNVYINGHSAYEDFDLSGSTGQLASPYYVDFVVDADSSGLLNVSIGRSEMSDLSRVRGLLNGLEIMKINNTVGSLGGELAAISILGTRTRVTFGAFVRSVVCGFAFMGVLMIGIMLALRWRAESRSQATWSPLPMDDASGIKSTKGGQMLSGKAVYF